MNSFGDRLQWEQEKAEAHWQELVTSRLNERVIATRRSRAAQVGDEREIARRIRDLPRNERTVKWKELTKKSEAALYRRMAEI